MKTVVRQKYFFLLLLFSLNAQAQVGIGTTTPQANLDIPAVNATNPANTDGILIPRINAFPATNPTVNQQGMMVFLTTATTFSGNPKIPGFYYWNNPTTDWIAVGNNSTTGWQLSGNAGTNATTNFIGTTDNVDLLFRRNNLRAGRLGENNTSFGLNSLNPATTGTRNTAIGANVLNNNTSGTRNTGIGENTLFSNTSGGENIAIGAGSLYSNTTGNQNSAIGRNVLTTNSTGSSNTGVGYLALRDNTTGEFNTAVGRSSLLNNSDGVQNTAVGVNALFANTTGGFNSVLGVQAGRENTTGTNNTAIGFQSLFSNVSGASNVAIGNQAGYFETGSNRLYIENSDADANNALIYGEFDNNILRTNSEFQIGNPTSTGYAFPTTDGTSGQILETDGNGALSWVNPNNNKTIVRSTLLANQSLGTTGWEKILFDFTVYDTNSEFSTTNNRFVAASAGFFQINAGFHTDNQNNGQFYSIGVYVNGNLFQETTGNHLNNGPVHRNINCIVQLNATDYVEIYVQNYQIGVEIDSFPSKTFFEVQQVR